MRNLSENYITIQGWMRTDLNLVGNELLIYALINGFCQDDRSCFTGSLSYICDWTGTSKPTVIKALKSLCEKGVLERIEKPINGVLFVEYRTLQGVKKFDRGSKESLPRGSKESLPNKDIKEKDIDKDNSSRFIDLFHDLCPRMQKIRKLSPKRESLLKARLAEYSEDDVKTVFLNAGRSDFLNGNNDRGWKADFDWLLNPNHFLKVLEGGYQGSQRIAGTCGTVREADRKFEDPTDIFG